jgi:hypothetical protein
MRYIGSCHCGDTRFEVEGEFGAAIECNCSHCSRKGYLLWFAPRERFELKTPKNKLGVYTFNKHVIEHHFCKRCGTATFGFGTAPDGAKTVAINIRCLDGVDLGTVERTPFDGKSR